MLFLLVFLTLVLLPVLNRHNIVLNLFDVVQHTYDPDEVLLLVEVQDDVVGVLLLLWLFGEDLEAMKGRKQLLTDLVCVGAVEDFVAFGCEDLEVVVGGGVLYFEL
jgi:hypothetical protein